ncbi:hypothetical protein Q2426_09925, partial [Escherichia coli]|nr:hypothetical protein [Escherichia coli]
VLLNLPRVGLTPVARGNPNPKFSQKPGPRFIPAGAGNTQFHMSRRAGSSVYPRWRGEHTKHT